MLSARSRRALKWAAVPLLCAAVIAIPDVRTALLRSVGWLLVADDPVTGPADIIVLSIDSGGAGVLEAADLVKRGVAQRVAVFAGPPDRVSREFQHRGVAYEDRATRSIRELESLGVSLVERVPMAVNGTEDEGENLPAWCDQNEFGLVLIISSSDHSRRLRRVLNRNMEGHKTKVRIRYARYSQFDPDHWWQTRASVRTGIVELQKLLLDIVRHPLS